jgi:hypothetical protein
MKNLTIENIFYGIIVILYCITTVLLHQIETADMFVWYLIGTPLVLIRLWRCKLLINIINKKP